MDMHKNFHRRIRIEGKPNEVQGYMLTVHDAETGEEISNVESIELRVGVGHENSATLHYYEKHASGRIVKNNSEPVMGEVTTHDPELSNITAYTRN